MKKGKYFLTLIVTLGILAGSMTASAAEVEQIFTDVHQGDWFYDYVSYVYEHKYMTGLSDSVFGPVDKLCRAQFVTILYRTAGCPEVEYNNTFPDVSKGQFYTDAVAWASSEDIAIVTGYSNGFFGPNDDITREQMAVMLYRYASLQYDTGDRGSLNKFGDGNWVSGFAQDAMRWAIASDIISGNGNEMLKPQGVTNRAESAAMLMRYQKYCEAGGPVSKPYYRYYREKLEDIYNNPWKYIDGYGEFGNVSENVFTIRDINRDGVDELIVSITTSYMAGMYTEIWRYDEVSQEIVSLGRISAECDYYSNGVVKAYASHNHTSGFKIWPYSLCRYDSNTAGYTWFVSAYCLEKEYDIYNEYSVAEDEDRDGVIYYFEYKDGSRVPLTLKQYNDLVQKNIPDNLKMAMGWKALEWSNISRVVR